MCKLNRRLRLIIQILNLQQTQHFPHPGSRFSMCGNAGFWSMGSSGTKLYDDETIYPISTSLGPKFNLAAGLG